MSVKYLQNNQTANVTAAGTLVLPSTGQYVVVPGNTTITGIDDVDTNGVTIGAGQVRYIAFTGTPQVTYNGTSMIMIGAATVANMNGYVSTFIHKGSGNWQEIGRNALGASAAILSKPSTAATLDSSASINSGLVGCWLINEGSGTTLNDLTANNNDGTISGATWATDTDEDEVLSGDGTDDYVTCGNGASLNPTSGLTVAFWFNPGEVITNNIWVARDDNALGRSYSIIQGGDNVGLNINGNGTYDVEAGFLAGRWYFFVTRGNASVGWEGWVNGVLIAKAAWEAPNSTTGATTFMKRTYSGQENFSQGKLSNVRIYNRAISRNEILELFYHPFSGINS